MSEELSSTEYEQLTLEMADRLAKHFGVLTTRLEHNVVVQGVASSNQIDVLWEGRLEGGVQRLVLECKRYRRPVEQQIVHAFRSVVDDIGHDMPTTGVLVTSTGYQSGAKKVADTYGLVIVELRAPTPADTDGRVMQIHIELVARQVVIRDARFEAVDMLDPAWSTGHAQIGDVVIESSPGGVKQTLDRVLTDGELSSLHAPPTPLHTVERTFDPPVALSIEGNHVATVRRVTAIVGDSDSKSTIVVGPGLEGLAYIARDALEGTTAWFTKDGKVRVVDGPSRLS